MKILVVEDERKTSDIVKAYLERDGFSVTVADTGGVSKPFFISQRSSKHATSGGSNNNR
jgi:DNA-binding response OmpR family regulator